MLKNVLTVLVALPALLFVVMGLRWLVEPEGIAPELGLVIDSGIGLSTQIGDFSAFFLTIGLCIFAALATGQRTWFYPPIALLSIAAAGRVVAWLYHDAALALSLIGVEIAFSLLFFAASRFLTDQTNR